MDDALLDTELHGELADDEQRFKEAWVGDDLMCVFQCDDCSFYNLQGRFANAHKEADKLLLLCIQRAILDSFWSRERTTVEKNWREVRGLIEAGEAMGLDQPLPQRGPCPVADDQGLKVACLMLMKTMNQGRNSRHIQFETARKVRSAVSNFYHALLGGTGLATVGHGDRGGLFFSGSPTNSHWYKRFMTGCHRRMGDVWIPDQATTLDEVKAGLAVLEEEWQGGLQGARKREVALTGALVVAGFVAALRGEEIPQIDIGLMRKYWVEGIEYPRKKRVPLALAGRFKQTNGTFRIYIHPLADTTSSGIEVRLWLERAIRCWNANGVTSGPLFRVTKGNGKVSRASVGDLDVLFHDLWKRVQHRYPQLIPDTTKVEEAYSVRRSLRRGATTKAQNRAIPTDVLEANNRWRKHLRGRGILPTMSMVERYTDAKASVEALVRFSELM